MVRSGKCKLIEFYEDNHVELYNLKTDISENFDLSHEFPGIVDKLRKKLHIWRTLTGAQMPGKNPGFEPGKAYKRAQSSKKNKER
jgi:hypothetical protein